jgi:DNA-binding transcriptional MerR regulator
MSEPLTSEALLRIAHEAGYDNLIGRRLEHWRSKGLLPRPTKVGQDGLRPIWVYPDGSDRQLLSILYWRRTTTNLDAIRVAVAAEGHTIDPAAVRQSMLAVIDRAAQRFDKELKRIEPAASLSDSPADREALDRALQTIAHTGARLRKRNAPAPRTSNTTLGEREQGLLTLLRLSVELPFSPGDLEQMEKAMGISRGRRGAGKEHRWVTEPPERLAELIARTTSLRVLRGAVNTASDQELRIATRAASVLVRGLPAIWAMATLQLGRGAAGLAGLEPLRRLPAEGLAFITALLVVAIRDGFVDNLRDIIGALVEARTLDLDKLRRMPTEARAEAMNRIDERNERRQLERLLEQLDST